MELAKQGISISIPYMKLEKEAEYMGVIGSTEKI